MHKTVRHANANIEYHSFLEKIQLNTTLISIFRSQKYYIQLHFKDKNHYLRLVGMDYGQTNKDPWGVVFLTPVKVEIEF